MTHILIKDCHCVPEEWLASIDRQSMTRCIYYTPLTSTECQICLEVHGQHNMQCGVYGAASKHSKSFSEEPGRRGLIWA